MDEDAPKRDADGWYEVPPDTKPDPLALRDVYDGEWSYDRRYPRPIETLDFIAHLRGDESDYSDSLLDREMVSVLAIPEFSDGRISWQRAYEEVRGAAHTSLANCRLFEITAPGGARTVQLWLDSEHPLQDSVFFNYSGSGEWCLVVRRVTHVRFHTPFGVDTHEHPIKETETSPPNFPYYVVQWGEKQAFVAECGKKQAFVAECGKLNTVLLNVDGENFEDLGDDSDLTKPRTVYKARDYYLRANGTEFWFPRFTYLNELSLMPHSEAVKRSADRVGKRWSEAFRKRYYRPRLGDAKGGRGYEKDRAKFDDELGGSSSTDPPPQPVPKRELSEETQRRMLELWKGSAKKKRR